MPVRDSVIATIKLKSSEAPLPAGISASERQGRDSTASHSRCHSESCQGSSGRACSSMLFAGPPVGPRLPKALLKAWLQRGP